MNGEWIGESESAAFGFVWDLALCDWRGGSERESAALLALKFVVTVMSPKWRTTPTTILFSPNDSGHNTNTALA